MARKATKTKPQPAMTETEFYDKAEQFLREIVADNPRLAVWRVRESTFQGRFRKDALFVGHPETEQPEVPSDYIILGIAKEILDPRFLNQKARIKIFYDDGQRTEGGVGGSIPGEHLLRRLKEVAENLRTF